MGNFLQQLGETMFKLKWWIVLGWAIILVILGVIVGQVGVSTSNSISIPGTEAQQTLERFNELFPEAGAQSAKVVVAAPEGNTINDYQEAIETLSTDIAKVNEVTAAISPFANPMAVSEDRTVGFVTVQLKAEAEVADDAAKIADALKAADPNKIKAVDEIVGVEENLLRTGHVPTGEEKMARFMLDDAEMLARLRYLYGGKRVDDIAEEWARMRSISKGQSLLIQSC